MIATTLTRNLDGGDLMMIVMIDTPEEILLQTPEDTILQVHGGQDTIEAMPVLGIMAEIVIPGGIIAEIEIENVMG